MWLSRDSFSVVLNISQRCNNIFIDSNSLEEDPLIKKLVVVMEEDRGMIHCRETQCRDTKLKDGGGGRERRENLRFLKGCINYG